MRRATFLLLFVIFCVIVYADSAHSSHITKSPCKVRYPSDTKIKWECRRIKKGETLENLFGEMWVDVARFNRIDRRHVYPGISLKVPLNLSDIKNFSPMQGLDAPAKDEAKFILINLRAVLRSL